MLLMGYYFLIVWGFFLHGLITLRKNDAKI